MKMLVAWGILNGGVYMNVWREFCKLTIIQIVYLEHIFDQNQFLIIYCQFEASEAESNLSIDL